MLREMETMCDTSPSLRSAENYRYSEDIEMWRSARDYYLERGLDDLAQAAEKQFMRLADAMIEDFLKGRTVSLMSGVTAERRAQWGRFR